MIVSSLEYLVFFPSSSEMKVQVAQSYTSPSSCCSLDLSDSPHCWDNCFLFPFSAFDSQIDLLNKIWLCPFPVKTTHGLLTFRGGESFFNFMALRPVYDAVWPSCPSGAFLWIDLHLSLHPLALFLLLKFTREFFAFFDQHNTLSPSDPSSPELTLLTWLQTRLSGRDLAAPPSPQPLPWEAPPGSTGLFFPFGHLLLCDVTLTSLCDYPALPTHLATPLGMVIYTFLLIILCQMRIIVPGI